MPTRPGGLRLGASDPLAQHMSEKHLVECPGAAAAVVVSPASAAGSGAGFVVNGSDNSVKALPVSI